MEYRISLTESAKGDIGRFEAHEQRIIAHLKAGCGSPNEEEETAPTPIRSLRGNSGLIDTGFSTRLKQRAL